MDLIQNKDLLESLSYLIAILGGIFVSIYFLIKYYKAYDKRISQAYSGFWINEGCINPKNEETHSIELALESDNRELSGTINVQKYSEDAHWNGLSIDGKRFLKRASINIIHIRKGEVLKVATVKLSLKKKEMIWKLKNGTADFLPTKTIL